MMERVLTTWVFCLSSVDTEHALRVSEMDTAQQLKLRDRQRFFEEVFQHDVDVYFSSAHLQIDYKRPQMSSISSMEVNVDMLEQMELLDISDPEAFDVFLASNEEDDADSSPLPVLGGSSIACDTLMGEISLKVPDACELKSRMSSTSSTSTSDSQGEDGAETPVVQSDEEDVRDDVDDDGLLIMGTPPGSGAEGDQS